MHRGKHYTLPPELPYRGCTLKDLTPVPRLEHYIKGGGWFAGPAEELVAHLRMFEERSPGAEHISLSMPMDTPEAIMLDQYRRVGEAVIPAFKGRR